MRLKEMPTQMLPRERLLENGAGALSDAELLAIILRVGSQEMNVVELADHLLRSFGSLRSLFSADLATFSTYKGLGAAKYAHFQAMLELSKRYLAETIERGNMFTNPNDIKLYLSSHIRDLQRESFMVLHLDNQHRLIEAEILFKGTINAASVYVRDVIKSALDKHSAAVVLAHNHPSGVAEPSQADRSITKNITDALALVEIRMLDHFVIGDGEIVSFAERGWI